MRALVLSASFALAFVALGAQASHCSTWWSAQPEVDTGPGPARFYLDNDIVMKGYSIWLYMESNGIDGLQREDETEDTTCHDMIPADTVIF